MKTMIRSPLSSWQLVLALGVCFGRYSRIFSDAFAPLSSPSSTQFVSSRSISRKGTALLQSLGSNEEDQAFEALRSLVDYHEGSWKGRATSFSVTLDVAAGVVQRHTSPDYQTSVRLQLSNKEYSLAETLQWEEKIVYRACSLAQSNADVDSVDASYSLDSALLDLPSEISGTDKLVQFGIEHCLATSDNERVRCFVLYGVDRSLARIVICDENRVMTDEKVSPQELLSLNDDVDRIVGKITQQMKGNDGSTPRSEAAESDQERMEKLQRALSSSDTSSSQQEEGLALTRRTMSLMDMTSGVWLGDTIIRDVADVKLSPNDSGRGFSSASRKPALKKPQSFADWTVGVHKVAWQLAWDYGEKVSQVYDFGRGMGAETSAALPRALSGDLCVNESFSRQIPKDERMVYVDFDNGDYVGFMRGSVCIQVPRFLTFSSASKQTKPFFTEFSVFQSNKPAESVDSKTNRVEKDETEVCCSKIVRLYNSDGQLKQGCTSFFTLKDVSMDNA